MKGNTTYESPSVEVIEMEVEQGFAASAAGDGEDIPIESAFPW